MSSERDDRVLSAVTREARAEPLPAVDWDAMEARLPMTRVESLPPRARNVRAWLYAATFLLGAGGLGLTLARSHGVAPPGAQVSAPAARAAAAPASTSDLNGDLLAVGAHVTSAELPQGVVHAGHARWTLAPHGEATLLARGELVTVRLDRGTVSARVTKSSRTETFAVEAADVRVAAHGTEFVVLLGADGVSVTVTEGSVLVGPRAEPGTGQALIGPATKRYTLGGLPLEASHGLDALRAPHGSDTVDGPTASDVVPSRTAAPSDALAKRPTARKVDAATTTAEDDADAPEQPSPAGLESTTRAVQALTQSCFKERTVAGEGVRVTAQSSLTFRTLPRGAVSRVVFEPPLSPAVQACVSAGVGAIHAEATKHGYQVSRSVDLER